MPCWDVEGGEEFFSLGGGRGPAAVIWWPLASIFRGLVEWVWVASLPVSWG